MPHHTQADISRILNNFRHQSGRRTWGFDVFYCPIDLFEHIGEIVVLYESQRDQQEIAMLNNIDKAVRIINAIQIWSMPVESKLRHHTIEVWRTGILLYLARLFHLTNDILNKADLIETIFHHRHAIPSNTSWSYATSWPLFQAGLLLTSEDHHKTWLRNELHSNFQTLGCFHQKLAVDALDQLWQANDDVLDPLLAIKSPFRRAIFY
ncbi:uncharacterized protein HMPREF1541_04148 [Cyphellophora europaea CBS 101466]|uniref:Transcription factor domain-containing protein n=1 Tax=Cyphellophora europaea (strain CBS 101466) TaxID=1220924 RepID=W2S0J8_CYPE1|nr:uncharacterized protein HMPREF1541_04148 [Cyphellophora europaea CBS 101466]ETN42207.1 hypothetical protein HMPREF1541_04148 [Cyphellophora europaea CBS 101466]